MSAQVLSVSLPSEIIYVSGTVNGTAYTWTLIEGAWTATVERAADDTYAVALTAVTAAGVSTNYALTLYYGLLSLITDRTRADVENETDKGFYNASDLNRVGAAVEYIAGRFAALGYACPVTVKKDWLTSDAPTASQMEAYRQNIVTLRGQIAVMQSTPDAPASMAGLDYVKANNIEQILADKNCSFNSVTDMITTDANCYNLPNLQSVTFGFLNDTNKLYGVDVKYTKDMDNAFNKYLSALKKKYGKPSKSRIPFVGNKHVEWRTKHLVVVLDEPHMSFEGIITYWDKQTYQSNLQHDKDTQKKNEQDLNDLI